MTKPQLWTLISLLVIVVGLGSFAAGYQVAYQQTQNMLRLEVAGNLTQDLLALSHLRIGQQERVVESIESNVDRAVATLGQKDRDDWTPPLVSAMRLASLYRSMYPTSREEPVRVLEAVEPADPSDCTPAFQELIRAHRTQ